MNKLVVDLLQQKGFNLEVALLVVIY